MRNVYAALAGLTVAVLAVSWGLPLPAAAGAGALAGFLMHRRLRARP